MEKKTAYERMMSKVRTATEDPEGCWLFLGALDRNGHGNVFVERREDGRNIVDKAHRIAFREHHGPIPPGHVIRHSCDVRNCVAPHHVESGTQLMNVWDMIQRDRAHTARGEGGRFTSAADAMAFA